MEKYAVYSYRSYVKRSIVLCLLPWLVPIVYLLTKESNEVVAWGCFLFPFCFCALSVGLLRFARNVFLGHLSAFELDFRAVYELDKRDERKHAAHNLKLLIKAYFYEGAFDQVIACCEILPKKNTTDEEFAKLYTALALFFKGDYKDIRLLSLAENNTPPPHTAFNDTEGIYAFLSYYLNGWYDDALQVSRGLLNAKGIDVARHKKLLATMFLLQTAEKLGDVLLIQRCTTDILSIDPNGRTFFQSKTGKTGDGSVS